MIYGKYGKASGVAKQVNTSFTGYYMVALFGKLYRYDWIVRY